jgi:hypothetical protein
MCVACIFTPTWHVHRVGLLPFLMPRYVAAVVAVGAKTVVWDIAHSRVKVIISTLVAPVGYRCHEVKRFCPSRRGGCHCSPPNV